MRRPSRIAVWILVILAHGGLVGAMLLSRPPPSRDRVVAGQPRPLLLLPSSTSKTVTSKFDMRIHVDSPIPSAISRPTMPLISAEGAITLSPAEQQQQKIDWDREAAVAVASSMALAAKEKNYRDLASLTPDELEWVKQNHLEPMPEFKWDKYNRRELLRHGIVKINDYCVLIVVIPFCRFGAKIQYNGDLFEHMRDPKPLDR